MNTKIKIWRAFALFMVLNFLLEILTPSVAWALTGGPASPEFASFEPVATTDMVNPFTGDLTYNLPVISIPGPDGAGYSMSLSYHSGANIEEEASWVGYGWTLNPGAINRSVRGFPDDYKNTFVRYYNKARPNWTVMGQDLLSLEFFSNSDWKTAKAEDHSPSSSFPKIELSQMLRYNNYNGFIRTYGMGVGFMGASANATVGASGVTYSASINIMKLLNSAFPSHKRKKEQEQTTESNQNKQTSKSKQLKFMEKSIKSKAMRASTVSSYGITSFGTFSMAAAASRYKGLGLMFNTSKGIHPSQAPIGLEYGIVGNFSMQWNEPYQDFLANGYLNNTVRADYGDGESNVPLLSDHYLEKDAAFDARDLFIAMPFANYDTYALSGEGLAGGFRPFHLSSGHYYNNFVASNTTNINAGLEAKVGLNLDIGVNFGVGNNKLRIKDWGNAGNTGSFQYDKNAGSIFRFSNDMGGKAEYAPSSSVTTARLIVNPDVPMVKGARPSISESQVYKYLNNAASSGEAKEKAGRSSFVTELKEDPSSPDRITGFEVIKESGDRYKYGLPVYTQNEINLSVDVNPEKNQVIENSLVFRPTDISSTGFDNGALNNYHTVNGYTRTGNQSKYVTAYLLTEITTQDYIDANGNGIADDADFGGWTKFDYRKVHGNYRWKTPYTGLTYQKRELSSTKDDVGTVATGEKEVYYLEKVSTKTHTAYFVTNKVDPSGKDQHSNRDRLDGLSAHIATDNPSAKGTDRTQYLEKIVLYSNTRADKPIKTVNFAYTNELVANTPNNEYARYPLNASRQNSGKLTLKKVWFDYEGVINARISPYEFFYRYKDKFDYAPALKNKYPQLTSFFTLSDRYTDLAQNPEYSPYFLDAWGYTQPYGREQTQKMRGWRYQGNIAQAEYDPAAYQLKQIKLPSGGEILIEYEEKDYRYVQNRPVMAMVSLAESEENNYPSESNQYTKLPAYTLNLDDIAHESEVGREAVEEAMRAYFITQKNRIYFKFLYQFIGDDLPSLNDCRSEYIDGYAKVAQVGIVGNKLRIVLDGEGSGYDGDDKNYPMTPRQGCYDYYSSQRVGMYEGAGCTSKYESKEAHVEALANANSEDLGGLRLFVQRMKFAIDMMYSLRSDISNSDYQPPQKKTVCRKINHELSYMRIPMAKTKKGGGCRVAKLLTYDAGIESADAGAVYGNTYRYEDAAGLSSGVATNEPVGMRDENPLVTFMPKGEQKWMSRLTIGHDKEQTEGPLGESTLPSPSVGHSRVVIENIHQGVSGDGFSIQTYHTVKDYPYDKLYGNTESETPSGEPRRYDFSNTPGMSHSTLSSNSAKDKAPINAGMFSYNSQKFWNTQGFSFIQNQMHGQAKSIEKYSGTYPQYQTNKDLVYLAFAQEFEYFEPGERVRMLRKNPGGQIVCVWDTPGKEMDLSMYARSIKERSLDFALEVDISIGLSVTPPIFVNGVPTFQYAENILNIHSTTKVVSYPAIQRATKLYQDGVWVRTDYLAFDIATGKPLVTRSTDIYDRMQLDCARYDGSVYATSMPAHWYYDAMGQRSADPANSNQLTATAGTVVTFGRYGNPVKTDTFQIPTMAVLDAQIQTYSNGHSLQTSWFDNVVADEYNVGAGAVALLKNIYRPHQQYVYKTDVTSVETEKIFKAGLYTSFVPYDFSTTTQDPGWIKTTEVTRYTPHGMIAEERDVLDIPAAARFGYGFATPTIVGRNVEYESLWFEDFENNALAVSGVAHSGKKSMAMSGGALELVPSVSFTNRILSGGLLVRFWLRSSEPLLQPLTASMAGLGIEVKAQKIAQTGEWVLYTADFSAAKIAGSSGTAAVQLTYPQQGESIFVDDVKLQPMDAEVTCFVYDVATLRLIAQFDDQHFGLYYQYNDEGRLVRKLIETEKGLKTIQESQYNQPKQYKRQ